MLTEHAHRTFSQNMLTCILSRACLEWVKVRRARETERRHREEETETERRHREEESERDREKAQRGRDRDREKA